MYYSRLLFLLLAGLITQFELLAQSPTPFGMIENSAAEIELTDSPNQEKLDRARKIYENLIAAKGDYRTPAPPLRFTLGKKKIAFLEEDGRSIVLEELGYDILDKFGDAGLAFILGHELSHFYEKHGYAYETFQTYNDPELATALETAGKAMPDKDVFRKLESAVEASRKQLTKVMAEKEADYLGGFLAYSAGYDVGQGDEIMGALYDGYDLEDNISGYLSRKQRVDMAKKASKEVGQFIDVFDLANLMIAHNRYADARTLYKHILEKYQGREIFNNLGVLTVLEAMEYFSKEEKKYHLPLELDLTFNAATKGVEDQKLLRRKLLDEARSYFASAISLDPDYAPAYLNMACVYYLLEDRARATFYAQTEAKQRATANTSRFPGTAANAEVLLALIDIRAGNTTAAKDKLTALGNSTPLAPRNLAILNGTPEPEREADFYSTLDWEVDGVEESSDLDTKGQRLNKATKIKLFSAAKMNFWEEDNSTFFRYTPAQESKREEFEILLTKTDYKGDEEEDFGIGSTATQIKEEYGPPSKKMTTVNGEIWVYDFRTLIFGADQTVKRWAIKK